MVAAARQEGILLDLDTCPECKQPYDGAACVHSEGCALGLWEYEDQEWAAEEAARAAAVQIRMNGEQETPR
jgi:hypothetical protein